LLTTLAIGSFLDVGNFPTSLDLPPNRGDSFMISLGCFGDLPIGLLGVGFEQLSDQIAPLLDGQVAPVDIGRDHERGGLGVGAEDFDAVARFDPGLATCTITIAAVENHALVEHDQLA
jgi:hypothetical protein